MSGHVDAESLALYAEGQLSRRRTARVRAHLSGCAECARTAAALTEVTTRLSQVPVPPIPSVVAARLDAALSAESAHRAAAPDAAPAPALAPAGPPDPRPPRRNPLWSPGGLRILAATGATLVVAGGVGYVLSQSGSSGQTSSGSAASASSARPKPTHRSAIKAGPNVPPGSHAIRPNTPSGTRYVQSGTDYRPGALAGQTKNTLAQYDVPGLSGPGMLPATRVSGSVHNCVDQLALGRPVRLVDLAHYQQQPAIVIVLGDPDTVTVVKPSSCTKLHSAVAVTSGRTTR